MTSATLNYKDFAVPGLSEEALSGLYNYRNPSFTATMQEIVREGRAPSDMHPIRAERRLAQARALLEAIEEAGQSFNGRTFYRATTLDIYAPDWRERLSSRTPFTVTVPQLLSLAVSTADAETVARYTYPGFATFVVQIETDAPALYVPDRRMRVGGEVVANLSEVLFAPCRTLEYRGEFPLPDRTHVLHLVG